MEFEWDEAKEAQNILKHGVDFSVGELVFSDPLGIEEVDQDSDSNEVRLNLIGLAFGRELFVTYTERENVIRIISVRRAERHERESYWENR